MGANRRLKTEAFNARKESGRQGGGKGRNRDTEAIWPSCSARRVKKKDLL